MCLIVTCPFVPTSTQLKHQAKDLLRAIKRRDGEAIAELRARLPAKADLAATTLADAQFRCLGAQLRRRQLAPTRRRLQRGRGHLMRMIWRGFEHSS